MYNKGYVGSSRSIRSEEALENYEVPLSLINKDLISKLIRSLKLEEEEIKKLKCLNVAEWKFVGSKVGCSSWHHTGKFYNKTDHYSLESISEYILEHEIEDIKAKYKAFKEGEKATKEKLKKDYKVAYIKVQEWGGTRNYPKLIGYNEKIGIVVGDWFYYVISIERNNIGKYKVDANKVENIEEFDDYKSLVKKYSEFKNNKKNINYLVKSKCK